MSDYNNYSFEDFLSDENFIRWVRNPNSDTDLFWKKLMESHPEKGEIIKEAIFYIKHIEFKQSKTDSQQFDRVLRKVLQNRYSAKTNPYNSTQYLSSFWKVAAAIMLLITGFYVLVENKEKNAPIAEVTQVEQIVKENPDGQKSSFILPDGTLVKLNAGSCLSFPKQFKAGLRLVELIGEAFFEVKHDPVNPFVVRTSDLDVTALGTSFDVKAYNDDPMVKVVLTGGKVAIRDFRETKDSLVLVPGQKAQLIKETKEIQLSEFESDLDLGWKEDKIVFRSANLETFIKEVQRWYGVKIEVVGTPIHDWRINGAFQNMSLELLLESVKFGKDIEYSLNGKNLIIKT